MTGKSRVWKIHKIGSCRVFQARTKQHHKYQSFKPRTRRRRKKREERKRTEPNQAEEVEDELREEREKERESEVKIKQQQQQQLQQLGVIKGWGLHHGARLCLPSTADPATT